MPHVPGRGVETGLREWIDDMPPRDFT